MANEDEFREKSKQIKQELSSREIEANALISIDESLKWLCSHHSRQGWINVLVTIAVSVTTTAITVSTAFYLRSVDATELKEKLNGLFTMLFGV